MQDQITLDRIKLLHPAVREEALNIYNEICAALTGKAICRFAWTIRTFAQQTEEYAKGRTKPGKIVTNAKAGQSAHNFALACFSDDTEILTEDGWKFFSELDQTERVMVFKDGKLYYEKPTLYISNDYKGEMVSIQTRSVDLLVTPNHKMIVQRVTNKKWSTAWESLLASDIDYKYRIPTAGEFLNNGTVPEYPFSDKIDPETWWEFMGWYISEGTSCGVSNNIKRTHNGRFKVSISQKENSHEWHLIKDCLDRTGFHYNYLGHEFIIHSKELHSILFSLSNQHERRIPRYLLKANKKCLDILLESLLLGDGTHYEKRFTYWTVHHKLAEDVSELMILLGYSCVIGDRTPEPHMMPQGKMLQTFNKQYFVNSRNRTTQELRNGEDNYRCIQKEEYEGVVYCVSTEAGAVVVKRNGKISICGNCDIVLLKDTNGDGSFDIASWETDHDFDGDGQPDWIEIVNIFKRHGWEAGIDWHFKDAPHFQKLFGLSLIELLKRFNNKQVDANNYVKL